MLKINIIKRTFVRQTTEYDCGIACLKMLLNFTGREDDADKLAGLGINPDGLSLLELRNIARTYGLSASVVEMEIGYLRKITTPCILHLKNDSGADHFEVCYGNHKLTGSSQFLMADPAIQVYLLNEKDLISKWVSKAALYFDELPQNLQVYKRPSWVKIINSKTYPAGLWIIVPLASMFITFFGVALTWILQEGMKETEIFQTKVIEKLIMLLFIICIFKSLLSYFRQLILVRFNMSLNKQLTFKLIDAVLNAGTSFPGKLHTIIKNGFLDVQKVQTAITLFISVVLSDGMLLLFLLAGLTWLMPSAFLVVVVYLGMVFSAMFYNLSSIIYEQGRLKEVVAAHEKQLNIGTAFIKFEILMENLKSDHQKRHLKSLEVAKQISTRIAKKYLTIDCFGVLMIMIIFTIGVVKLNSQAIDYKSFMLIVVESYIISTVTPKICVAIQQIAEGVDASVQFGLL